MKLALTALFLCIALRAQNPSLEFEVASIKLNTSGSGDSESHTDQGRLTTRNFSLKSLISWAFGVRDYQLEGPDWLGSQRFDISAKFPEALPSGPENREQYNAAFRSMMQKMLQDRFHLTVHHTTKPSAVYGLVVGKNGVKFKEVPLGASHSSSRNTHYTGQSIAMDQFATFLSMRMELPVLNATGLKGYYDLTLDWVPESHSNKPETGAAPEGPTLADAVADQLGLKLEHRKAPIDMLVVDNVDKLPTEN
jgi:uncharacterized protein (TIGR03435 family)